MHPAPHPLTPSLTALRPLREPDDAPGRLSTTLWCLSLGLSLAACGGGGGNADSTAAAAGVPAPVTATAPSPAPAPAATPAPAPSTATRLSLGTLLFEEPALSASGKQACASCHTTPTAHADAAGTTLPLGGPGLDQQGFRSSPSLLYLAANAAFRFVGGLPFGGFTWDGRADSTLAQAGGPLLDATEMANPSVAAVADKVRRLSYFNDIVQVYGLSASATDQQVFDTTRQALADYQALDSDYLLFNSKFDLVQDGRSSFTAAEARGLAVFNGRGNCNSCHSSQVEADGSRPLFTNFSYAALGLPRNTAIRANADPAFFDMGLCGPKRSDLAARTDLCGQFKVPTLRNIALTAPYFHNASVATLEDAVSFYATRDTDPARWYPLVDGQPDRFNDLPPALRGNVIQTAPFGQGRGNAPRLSAQDVADLAAFLRTLSDDLSAPAGSAKVTR